MWRIGLPFLSGAIAGLGHVPFSLWPLSVVSFATIAFLVSERAHLRHAAMTAWLAGLGYFLVSLHWIYHPFQVHPDDRWMAPFGVFFMAGGLALFWAAAGALGHRGGALGWALALSLAELARGYVLTGFPWALPGHIWTNTIAAQSVAWIGANGLTAVTLVLAALPAGFARRAPRGAIALMAFAICGPLILGAARSGNAPVIEPTAPVLRLVQPNAPQDEKWLPEMAPVFFARSLDMTAAAGTPDLTIWPETSVPYFVAPGHPALNEISNAAQNRPVIFGAQRYDAPRIFNSLYLLEKNATLRARYDKHHLVPFGEYIPLGELGAKLGLPDFGANTGNGYSAGPGPQVLSQDAVGRFLPLICYEAIFPQDLRGPERPDWLLQITNDAWFGNLAGPQQHLAQAKLRAIENGLPLIRVANTGISAVIDARGAIRAQIPLNQSGFIDHPLPPALPETLYARVGDIPILIILIIAAFFVLIRHFSFTIAKHKKKG